MKKDGARLIFSPSDLIQFMGSEFDADRTARALQLIGEQSERFQFVTLTCHPGRYLELGNAVSTPVEQLGSAVGAGEVRP